MPIYQYVCSKCNANFELRQGFHDENVAPCPKCKSESKRRFMPVPIIFKGSGFYVTDSRSPGDTQLPAKIAETTKEVSVPTETSTTKPAAA